MVLEKGKFPIAEAKAALEISESLLQVAVIAQEALSGTSPAVEAFTPSSEVLPDPPSLGGDPPTMREKEELPKMPLVRR